MTSTAIYAIKRTVVDRLTVLSGTGQLFDGVKILYAYEGEPTDTCIYLGGGNFEQPGDLDVTDGDDRLAEEASTFGLYIRLVRHAIPVRQVEAEIETIGDRVGAILRKEPRMCGPNTYIRIAGGTADYQQHDDGTTAILAFRVTTTAYV